MSPPAGTVKVSREGVPELRLSDQEVGEMERISLERGDLQGHLLIALMARRGWRVSSVVGYEKHSRYVQKKTGVLVEKDYSLPGLRREDVGEDSVAVHMKGGKVQWQYITEPYMSRLKELAGKTYFGERLIPWTEDHCNDVLVDYARAAGVSHPERIHAHRYRHYFGTHMSRNVGGDVLKLKSLMAHKDIRATAIYVAELTPEEEKQILDAAAK